MRPDNAHSSKIRPSPHHSLPLPRNLPCPPRQTLSLPREYLHTHTPTHTPTSHLPRAQVRQQRVDHGLAEENFLGEGAFPRRGDGDVFVVLNWGAG